MVFFSFFSTLLCLLAKLLLLFNSCFVEDLATALDESADFLQTPPGTNLPPLPDSVATNATTSTAEASKDQTCAAVDIVSSNTRHHAPTGALRQIILDKELQLFDAALLKTFPNISSSAIAVIIQNASRRMAAPGAVIFRQGDVSSDMIFLCSGSLDVQKQGAVTAHIDCNNIVGHHAYLYHRPRSATVVVGSGPQCIYYVFSIDQLPAEADVKPGVWNSHNARITPAKGSHSHSQAPNISLTSDPELRSDLVAAEVDVGHFSPQCKRRMSLLLGEEASTRRYSRDVLDCGQMQSLSPPSQTADARPGNSDRRSSAKPHQLLDSGASSHHRPTSAGSARSMRRSSASSPLRPATSRAKMPLASSPDDGAAALELLDISDLMSPRKATRAGLASSSPRQSIVARSMDAVQQQLSRSCAGASSCIMFSAAWLLLFTKLEKTRTSAPRHSLCRFLCPLLATVLRV
jgi:hypothetical protein